jgi:hypothetical protein
MGKKFEFTVWRWGFQQAGNSYARLFHPNCVKEQAVSATQDKGARLTFYHLVLNSYFPYNTSLPPPPPKKTTNIYRYLMEDSIFLLKILAKGQCFGSGFNQVSGSVSGSGSSRAKMTHRNRKKLINFIF